MRTSIEQSSTDSPVGVPAPAGDRRASARRTRRVAVLAVAAAALATTLVLARSDALPATGARSNSPSTLPTPLVRAVDGHAAIVLFVSATCPHCHAEMARLSQNEALRTLAEDPRVRVLVVAPEGAATMAALLPGVPTTAMDDASAEVRRALAIRGVPTRFHFDAAGRLQLRQSGEVADATTREQLTSFAATLGDPR